MYAAASRNIGNITGGNMGAGIAGNITALNQAGTNYGKLRSAIADADLKNRTGVAEFNNKGAYQGTGGLGEPFPEGEDQFRRNGGCPDEPWMGPSSQPFPWDSFPHKEAGETLYQSPG